MNETGPLAWSVAGRPVGDPLEGLASGDCHVVASYEGGVCLGVIDGLGHGDAAAEASRAAAAIVSEWASDPVERIFERCHEGLRATRGAVMTLSSVTFDDGAVTWAGVGNVEAILVRHDQLADPARTLPMLRGGIVGYQLPTVRPTRVLLAPGDWLVFATDGIRSGFMEALRPAGDVEQVAHALLEHFGRADDDALVLVARWRAEPT